MIGAKFPCSEPMSSGFGRSLQAIFPGVDNCNRPPRTALSAACGRLWKSHGAPSAAGFCVNAQAGRSARRNSTSPAIASPRSTPSWSCSMNYGPVSGVEMQASSHQKRGPDASGGLPGTDPETSTSPGRTMGGVDRNRGVTVGRDRQPSFDSANSFSVIGSARGTSAMLHPGVVDGLTASLAGRESGDRAERRSTISVGWSSPVARQAHNLKVVSSNLTPATIFDDRRAA